MYRTPVAFRASLLNVSICCMVFILIAASASMAQTQITSGVIQGTVTDDHGAAVAGATIEATNLDTNLANTLTTESDGRFVFLQLSIGTYRVTVTKQGFATIVQQNLALTVGQAVSLSFGLKVSSVAETITITASPTIDSTKTESSTTLNAT